jgi:ATP-dependent RNA helicase DeaD
MEKFIALGLSESTVATLQRKGFEEPTEIQAKTIPLLLQADNEKDVIAQAQTGTGKTAAFALPLIERLDPGQKGVQALILAPTRELVIQVCEEINSLKGDCPLIVSPIYGGQSIELQLKRLKKGVSIVVGTPGRLLDHIQRKSLRLNKISHFVLDEADEMLNMGFIEDIESILEHTPSEKRVMLFSATMPARIRNLAERYMGPYEQVRTKTTLTTSLTDQIYFQVANQDKFEALCRIIDIEQVFYGLVFCRTKVDVDGLTARLVDRGYSADGLHGDIAQAQRERILNKFRRQQTSILVATDVAARGIDINNLTHVINFSIPQNPEAYIHRIGRTGRAGNQGTAITFVTGAEFRQMNFIKKVTQADIRKERIPEVEDIISAKKTAITENLGRIIYANETNGVRRWATRLLDTHAPEELVAALLADAYGKDLDETNYQKITPARLKKNRKERGRSLVEEEGMTRLFIAKGKDKKLTKRSLVEYIVKKAGTPQQLIDQVEVHQTFSLITVPFAEAEFILKKFRKAQKPGRKSIVVKAKPRK